MTTPIKESSTPSFLQTSLVQEHLQWSSEAVGAMAAARYRETQSYFLGPGSGSRELHSPLEAVFYLWWHAEVTEPGGWLGGCLDLQTQVPVVACGRNYRLDFSVALQPHGNGGYNSDYIQEHGVPWKPIAIEVDGHAFHEKTLAQVEKRNERDRDLQQAGWTIFHFSYSELTERPQQCVSGVVDFVWLQAKECMEAARAIVKARAASQVAP